MTLPEALSVLASGGTLSFEEASGVMGFIMDGEVSPAQIGFLVGVLRARGETAEELAGFASAMRTRAVPVRPKSENLVDTCGTGGDRLKTFNLSTAAAFVAAAAGVPIAKHGGRAVTSRCGSADVLEAAGAKLDLSPEAIGECTDKIGIGFLFAPHHHPAMKHAAGARREMGVRTVFNLIGPLSNPAGATRQFIGVCEPHLPALFADVLTQLGCERAMVAYGEDGLDEFSPIGATTVVRLESGVVTSERIEPEDVGAPRVSAAQIAPGETAEANAALMREALSPRPSPRRDAIVLNSAAAIWVGGKAASMTEAVTLAISTLESGASLAKLEEFIEFTANAK